MKLKFFLTEILIELLQKSKSQADIYSAFKVTITKKMIMKNFSEYYYLFHFYHRLKYQKDLLYDYVKQEPTESFFIVEFGFQLSFLVTEMKNIPEFNEITDYKELFSSIEESREQPEDFLSRIKDLCINSDSIYNDIAVEEKQKEIMVKQ